MKRNLIPLIALLILSAGCRVSFVPDYDASVEQQIIDGAKANDKIYLELLADSADRSYSKYAQEYIDVQADINSIDLKIQASKHPKDMHYLDSVLLVHFIKYKDEHKQAAKPLTNAMIKDYQADVQAFWLILLKSEQGLPHATTNQ
jgi:hypothetical protein